MYGQNPVTHQTDIDTWDHKYNVTEIFPTIQGEGPYAGYPAIFVRLAGCNLRCHFCDTHFHNQHQWTVKEIMDEIASLHTNQPLVVFTGGEPLLQPIGRILQTLRWRLGGKVKVQIETAGTIYQPSILDVATIVLSPKTPQVNDKIANMAHYWKYLISVKDDHCPKTGIPITATQPGAPKARLALPRVLPIKVFLQIVEGPNEDAEANYAKMAQISMKHGYRASARLHTLMRLR
jgi:7-carboxy-7-deazaguanine synthase